MRRGRLGSVMFSLVAFIAASALAIAPRYVPDEELARRPIIAVARWNGAPLTVHKRVEGNVIKELEGRTEIMIERVVTGRTRTGRRRIILAPFVAWEAKGGPVRSYTSTEMVGATLDVRQANLWLLSPGRSWDHTKRSTFLVLDTYRGVQPLELEEYFQVLRSKSPQKHIQKLVTSTRPAVVLRALEYVAGGALPWPYEPDFHPVLKLNGPKRTRKLATQHAGVVAKLLSTENSEIRRRAAAVYAELAGRQCLQRMRALLADRDPIVRAIAIGTLARHRDRDSSEAISRSARGIDDPLIGCRVIDALARWGEIRIVPALIAFLQNDLLSYQFGHDIGIPAIKAHDALQALTGFSFPFDVHEGLRIWGQAATLATAPERTQYLGTMLSTAATPVSATFNVEGDTASITVTNTSARSVTLSKEPAWIDFQSEMGLFHHQFVPANQAAFLTLAPGESMQVRVRVESWFRGSKSKRVTFFYGQMGKDFGRSAWVGKVHAAIQ